MTMILGKAETILISLGITIVIAGKQMNDCVGNSLSLKIANAGAGAQMAAIRSIEGMRTGGAGFVAVYYRGPPANRPLVAGVSRTHEVDDGDPQCICHVGHARVDANKTIEAGKQRWQFG